MTGPEVELPEKTDLLAVRYRASLDGKRAIVLLDNVGSAEQLWPLRPPGGCVLIVTSREKLAFDGLAISLDELSVEEARDLLTGIAARPKLTAEVADRIAELCGYLPLAIRAAGNLLRVTEDLDPEQYAGELRDERTRLEKIGSRDIPIGVEASLNLSYLRLKPEAAAVFRELSVFPASFDATAEEVVCEDPGHKHLSDLVRLSLAPFDSDTGHYRLHDLVRVFAGNRLNVDERLGALLRFASHYRSVLATANDLYKKGSHELMRGLRLFDVELNNIQAGQAWAAECFKKSPEDRASAELCNKYPLAGFRIFLVRLHPKERINWIETGLTAARQLKDRGSEGAHLGNLGLAYDDLGDYRRAIDYHEQSLIILREIGDRLGEGQSLGNMGLAYDSLGEYRRAIDYHEQSLAIAREIGDRLGEGASLGNLGLAYYRLGDYRRDIDYHEQSLAIARELGDRLGEGAALGNLGIAYYRLGNYRRAIDYHEQSLVIAREIGDRLGEGTALGNLGGAYHALGDYNRAIDYHEQRLAIAREIGDRLGEGNTLYNKSLAIYELGERDEALPLATAALTIFEEIEAPAADQVREWIDRLTRETVSQIPE